jgi:acetylornithine deacetylase/succinyl-diaminopimelate desuccinylase-like protein
MAALASFNGGGGLEPLMTPLEEPLGRWASAAHRHRAGCGAHPDHGRGVPTAPFVQGLGVPIVLLPLVNADDNQHAANENLRLGNYLYGVGALAALFTKKLPR